MSSDILSDVLRAVRLRGAVFFYVSCIDEWVAEAPPARELAPAVLPGSEHLMEYHMVVKGDAWAATSGAAPARLGTGDIVMFPRGDAHVLSSAPGLRAESQPPESPESLEAMRVAQRPIPVTATRGVLEVGTDTAADRADTVVVCGFIGCDVRPFNPLIDALPPLLHLPAPAVGPWVAEMLRQAVAESRQRRPGSDAVLERASEMVFVDAARRYLDTLPAEASGWLAGLRDRHVGRALARLHADPARNWTLEELGREVALSRSALHERFVALVGTPPMQYLARWRMQVASGLLRHSRASVATIALEVGYESEAAFARAFKRETGVPPAAWRRAANAAGASGGAEGAPDPTRAGTADPSEPAAPPGVERGRPA